MYGCLKERDVRLKCVQIKAETRAEGAFYQFDLFPLLWTYKNASYCLCNGNWANSILTALTLLEPVCGLDYFHSIPWKLKDWLVFPWLGFPSSSRNFQPHFLCRHISTYLKVHSVAQWGTTILTASPAARSTSWVVTQLMGTAAKDFLD